MKNKKIFSRALCFILSLTVILLPTVVSISGMDTNEAEYDYSKAGSFFNTTLTSADILELLGYEISEGERAYLESYSTMSIKYDTVTNQYVRVVTQDDVTKVIARSYSYVSAKGNEANWTPVSVNIGAVEGSFVLDNGEYVADFGEISIDDESSVNVKYELDITFSIFKDSLNEILNLAYLNAPSIKSSVEEARAEYEAAYSIYEESYAQNIEAIKKYNADMILYDQYLIDKMIFDEKNAVYLQYLDDCDEYETQYILFEEYQTALDNYNDIIDNNLNYDDNYAKYLIDKAEYDDYFIKKALIKEQLKMLDNGLMTRVTYLKRQLYSSLLSGLVDRVTDNKEIFMIYFKDSESLFDDCKKASSKVKEILKPRRSPQYSELKSEADKYTFYVNNFEELREAILVLTRTLYKLYSNDELRILMHGVTAFGEEEYTERFSIFIAQLIYLSNAISDEPVMDYTGTFVLDENITLSYWDSTGKEVKNRKIIDILEGNEFVSAASDLEPIEGGYPSVVEEPTEPKILDVPDKPDYVAEPVMPDEVLPPGDEPETVEKPIAPDDMPEEPIRPEIIDNEIYALLISDYNAGLFCERDEITSDFDFTPTVTVERGLGESDIVTVVFVDLLGSVLYEVSVSKGTAVNYEGELPYREEDISASYEFDSWVDENGNPYNLASVEEDVVLHPYLKPSDKNYDVEYDGNTKYIDVSIENMDLTHLPMDRFVDRAIEENAGIRVSASNISIKLGYVDVLAFKTIGVYSLDVAVDTSTPGNYSCRIDAKDNHGQPVDIPGGIKIAIPCSDPVFANDLSITYVVDGEKKQLGQRYYSDGKIEFKTYVNTPYTLAVRYSINIPTSIKNVVTAPKDAAPGELVTISVEIPYGVTVDAYYITDSDSSAKHTITDFTFVMPSEHVNLRVRFTDIVYTVTFMSDGKVYKTGKYKYGDTVVVPNAPTKVNDGEYRYNFIGWSPEIETVVEDMVYTAVFESIPIPQEVQKYPWLKPVIYSVITVFSLGIVTLVVLILNKKGIIDIRGLFRPKQTEILPDNEESVTDEPQNTPSPDSQTENEETTEVSPDGENEQ